MVLPSAGALQRVRDRPAGDDFDRFADVAVLSVVVSMRIMPASVWIGHRFVADHVILDVQVVLDVQILSVFVRLGRGVQIGVVLLTEILA